VNVFVPANYVAWYKRSGPLMEGGRAPPFDQRAAVPQFNLGRDTINSVDWAMVSVAVPDRSRYLNSYDRSAPMKRIGPLSAAQFCMASSAQDYLQNSLTSLKAPS
jgi:hypothetical protein